MKSLISKTVFGFLTILVILGTCILLPAGTIKYLQAWIYILVFSISVVLITLYLYKYDKSLLERRVKAGAIAEKEKSQKIIQALANVFFVLPYVFAGLDHKYHWSNVSLYTSIIADILVAVGFFIVFIVFKENSYTSGIIEVAKDQKVISTGPYRIVRHPMYLGAIVMLIFSTIALGSYWALLFDIPILFTIIARLLNEEKFLLKNLSGYAEYCEKVRYHLIPLVW